MSSYPLDALGIRYGTDKCSRKHDYLRTYERHVVWMRDLPVKVLELGVLNGASLKVWRDFFPLGEIIGADYSPERAKQAGERIAIEIGDCGDPAFLRPLAEKHGPFDLIVDDASHIWKHQQDAFETLFPHLKPGGIYILEDIHTSYIPRYGDPFGGEATVDWLKWRLNDVVMASPEFVERHTGEYNRQWRDNVHEVTFVRESCIITKRLHKPRHA